MSQRLLISLKKNIIDKDESFDAIYTENGNLNTLLYIWCAYNPSTGHYLGPWKIVIRDQDFFDQFMEDFSKLKQYIPRLSSLADCWAIYENGKIIYESEKETSFLDSIIDKIIEEQEKYRE